MLAEKLGSIPGTDTIQYNMTQDEFILKAYEVVIKCGKAEVTCFRILSKTIGIPVSKLKQVVSDSRLFLDIWNRKEMDATEEELLNFPNYTWENLSETEKDWYNNELEVYKKEK
jgi:hypothetical protein